MTTLSGAIHARDKVFSLQCPPTPVVRVTTVEPDLRPATLRVHRLLAVDGKILLRSCGAATEPSLGAVRDTSQHIPAAPEVAAGFAFEDGVAAGVAASD